jgi:hypothetical protein
MPELPLRQREVRLVYLATVYHLGRPGSEIDPVTRQPHGYGLRSVRDGLRTYFEAAPVDSDVVLVLTEYQVSRLGVAILGVVNELKQVGISGRSVVRGLIEALTRVFPDEVTTEDPGGALDLAGEATMLHRRLAGAIRAADAAVEAARAAAEQAAQASRPWWKWWAHRA